MVSARSIIRAIFRGFKPKYCLLRHSIAIKFLDLFGRALIVTVLGWVGLGWVGRVVFLWWRGASSLCAVSSVKASMSYLICFIRNEK